MTPFDAKKVLCIVLMILSMFAAFVYAVYYLQVPDLYIPVEHEIIQIIGIALVRVKENLALVVAGVVLCIGVYYLWEDVL